MYFRVSSSALKFSMAVLQVISTLIAVYTTSSYLPLALLISPLLTFKLVNHVYLVSLGHATLVLILGGPSHLLLHVVSTSMIVLAIFTQFLISKSSRFTSNVITPLLLLAPAYIAVPHLIIYPVVSLTILLVLTTRAYLELSKCTSRVSKSRFTTYVGSTIEIPVEIVCQGDYKYSILVDGKVQVSCISKGSTTVLVRLSSNMLGVLRKELKVVVSDPRELARVEHGPFSVEISTTPRLTEVLSKAQEFIKRYVTYISLPLMLRGSIEPGRASLSAGTLASGMHGPLPGEEGHFTYTLGGGYYSIGDRSSSASPIPAYTDTLPRTALPAVVHAREFSRKAGLEVPAKIRWYVPFHVIEKMVEKAKSYVGEYMGVREYQPGDSPRTIHWKKSLRAPDRENLVVKLYSSESLEKSGGGRSIVVLADLVTPSLRELDLLLHTLYSLLLESVKSPENVAVKTYVYLILPRNKVYLLHGKVIDVVFALNTILLEEGVSALYDYEPYSRIKPTGKPPKGFLEVLDDYFNSIGIALVKDLVDRGVPRNSTVHLVFSRALSYKYTTIARVLEKTGYTVGIPIID